MKSYFGNKIFLLAFVVVGIVSVAFIAYTNSGEKLKNVIIKKVLNASFNKAGNFLTEDSEAAVLKLENMGFKVQRNKTIRDIAKESKISPFKVLSIIIN